MWIWRDFFGKIKINRVMGLVIMFLLVGWCQAKNGGGGDKDDGDMLRMGRGRDIGEMNRQVYKA